MKKNKIIALTLFFSFLSILSFAQKNGHNNNFDDEKIQAEKIAFITEKLDLTVEEAQAFWPLYNEFNGKISKLFTEERKLYREIKKNIETLSDEELTTKTDRLILINKEKSELEFEYHDKYKKVLPIKKIALLYRTDKEFRKHLMHKYKGAPEE